MLTVFGVVALSFMMLMYFFEDRGPGLVLAFGAWPFGAVEAVWMFIATIVGTWPEPGTLRKGNDRPPSGGGSQVGQSPYELGPDRLHPHA
jgi:hypothetical protein